MGVVAHLLEGGCRDRGLLMLLLLLRLLRWLLRWRWLHAVTFWPRRGRRLGGRCTAGRQLLPGYPCTAQTHV